jgi:membrane-associated protein
VLSIIAALLPLTGISFTDQVLQYGMWMYLLVFVVIMLASTIVGGPIPDNTFLVLAGAIALNNGLSMLWLFIVAAGGGVVGYEINYWCGRLFGLAISRGSCPLVPPDGNIRNALNLIDRFGAAALILSRFMPVLNLPSFIAGVNAMEYRRYIVFNLISSAVWCGSLLMIGYYFGSIGIVSEYLNYLMDFFIIILAVAIIIALCTVTRDYMKRKDGSAPE